MFDTNRRAYALLRSHGEASALERARLVRALRPAPADFDRVFHARAAASARASYGASWNARAFPRPRSEESELLVSSCRAAELGGPAGREFPRHYQLIAHQLRPELVWVRWELSEPGEVSGTAGEGLVEVDGRWLWLPQPWRHVSTLAADALEHWTA